MAKKELLFVVILLAGFTLNARAEERFEYREEDMEFAKDLAKHSRQTGMSGIREKWLELQQMLQEQRQSGNNNDLEGDQLLNIDPLKKNNTLRVFVSSSMGVELLKHYVAQARRYKAILVFNGLPDGSWRKLSDLIYEITEGKVASIQLDDTAFTKYSIKSVPAFVLSREESVFNEIDIDDVNANNQNRFDKVVGNIGIRRALEEIAAKGDLAYEAGKLLDEVRD